MRIGKCPKCNSEIVIKQMNWNGWREWGCKTCCFTLDNTKLKSSNFKECLMEVKE